MNYIYYNKYKKYKSKYIFTKQQGGFIDQSIIFFIDKLKDKFGEEVILNTNKQIFDFFNSGEKKNKDIYTFVGLISENENELKKNIEYIFNFKISNEEININTFYDILKFENILNCINCTEQENKPTLDNNTYTYDKDKGELKFNTIDSSLDSNLIVEYNDNNNDKIKKSNIMWQIIKPNLNCNRINYNTVFKKQPKINEYCNECIQYIKGIQDIEGIIKSYNINKKNNQEGGDPISIFLGSYLLKVVGSIFFNKVFNISKNKIKNSKFFLEKYGITNRSITYIENIKLLALEFSVYFNNDIDLSLSKNYNYINIISNNIIWKIFLLFEKNKEKFSLFIYKCIKLIDIEEFNKNKKFINIKDIKEIKYFIDIQKEIINIRKNYNLKCLNADKKSFEFVDQKNFYINYPQTTKKYYCIQTYENIQLFILKKNIFYFINLIFLVNFSLILDIFCEMKEEGFNLVNTREKIINLEKNMYNNEDCNLLKKINKKKGKIYNMFNLDAEISEEEYNTNKNIYDNIFLRLGINKKFKDTKN